MIDLHEQLYERLVNALRGLRREMIANGTDENAVLSPDNIIVEMTDDGAVVTFFAPKSAFTKSWQGDDTDYQSIVADFEADEIEDSVG